MGELSYELVASNGPDHNREYVTDVLIDGKAFATGKGSSIKGAEQMAAYLALMKLKKDEKK